MEFLSTSIAQLKVVQTKYVEAKDCLNVLNKSNEGMGEAGEGTWGTVASPRLCRVLPLWFSVEKTARYVVCIATQGPACCLRES